MAAGPGAVGLEVETLEGAGCSRLRARALSTISINERERTLLARFTIAAICGLCVAAATAAPSFAQSAGGCQLQGTASFSPGLNANAQPFSYSFAGALSGCSGTQSGVPATGSVSAGNAVTINGEQFQEPVPTGSGGCASSTTSGIAIATWDDGTQTVIEYSTSGAAAAVQLSGTAIASVTLPAINPQAGQPTSTTITTTRYGGETSSGLLAFQPPEPTACNTSTGATTAGISGGVTFDG